MTAPTKDNTMAEPSSVGECPFCGVAMVRIAGVRVDPYWRHPHPTECMISGITVTPGWLPKWNRRAPSTRGEVLEMEKRKDAAYLERNQVVAALAAAFPSGVARTNIPGWSEDWHGCVYIDLPTGQASWHYHDSHAHLFEHLPPYTGSWDGHTTEQKYERVAAFARWGAELGNGTRGQLIACASELYDALNDLLNDCINFDGGKLTEAFLVKASRTLAKARGEQ